MIKCEDLFNLLKQNNINCFCGVPDSLLKDFCAYITDNTDNKNHTITANEGNAIALAAGHYLATSNPALVYMQNSGLGNCVNPLLSLTDEEVYNIPLLMFIGLRGEIGKKDEPQHIKQGKVTDKLLDCMGIKYEIMPFEFNEAEKLLLKAFEYMKETNKPFAFIIRKGTFEKYSLKNKKDNNYTLKREEAIETVIKKLSEKDIIVSTTGHISREVYETRVRLNQSHKQDFLTVGSMGHASSIALGVALEKPDRNVYCFDGDGAFLMHQGALAVNASKELKNFKHIVFNNQAHDSVGSQPTVIYMEDIAKCAQFCGYKKTYSTKTKQELDSILDEFINNKDTSLLEIKVQCGAREDLGRPLEKPVENKEIFMQNLEQIEFCSRGAIKNLNKILKTEKAKNVLVFTGKKSFEPIKPLAQKEFEGCKITYYSDFSTNPKEEDVKKAIKNLQDEYDIIISIGGGSVIDFAKAYRFYKKSNLKLIAIPTTSGTGSESTQFAVIYVDGVKKSLDDKKILPEYVILDSQFIENNPKYLKATTALDAYCQAIESYFACNSTALSRKYALDSMKLCRDNIVNYVNSSDIEVCANMMKASNLAGRAINISRTTAAHAMSYSITSKYGLPHGHAVALNIAKLLKYNKNVDNDTLNDKRGVDFVKQRMKEIYDTIGFQDAEEYFSNLFIKIGIEYKDYKSDYIDPERLKNNPRKLVDFK